MKALAAYKKQGLNRLADMAGLSQGTGDAVQSFAMGATEPLDVKGALRAARRGIEAWHGSPHKFDKFSLEKIGTGEGAQAYGHGLYFAESKRVANAYRKQLSGLNGGVAPVMMLDNRPINVRGDASWVSRQDEYWRSNDPIGAALSVMAGDAQRYGIKSTRTLVQKIKNGQLAPPTRDKTILEAALKQAGKRLEIQGKGSLYRVRLDVSPDELLDLDAPLAAQEGVTKKLRDAGFGQFMGSDKGAVYTPHNAEQSAALRDAGVPGLKYLDGGSRASGDGTRNYVIFDPERIQILERLAALGIGGEAVRTMLAQAKAAAQPQQSQPPTLPAVTVGR